MSIVVKWQLSVVDTALTEREGRTAKAVPGRVAEPLADLGVRQACSRPKGTPSRSQLQQWDEHGLVFHPQAQLGQQSRPPTYLERLRIVRAFLQHQITQVDDWIAEEERKAAEWRCGIEARPPARTGCWS
ncbi:hypothetical protein [Streptomyces sp. NPDC088254]|uniref:hypothetical protein n=1 Tax=Streptomyces sp. NPDC088254 TaxID=3365847 RepID=UPI0037FAF2F3